MLAGMLITVTLTAEAVVMPTLTDVIVLVSRSSLDVNAQTITGRGGHQPTNHPGGIAERPHHWGSL